MLIVHFNRTIVELKHEKGKIQAIGYYNFNRTIVELKLVNVYIKTNTSKILIEP